MIQKGHKKIKQEKEKRVRTPSGVTSVRHMHRRSKDIIPNANYLESIM